MRVLTVRNVHEALPIGIYLLVHHGVKRNSRNGNVLVYPGPVTTKYEIPSERVLFWASRDANPFFHFMEGLWMIAGRRDVAWISQFSSNIGNYSDDGKTFHGAYGYRWRQHFDVDQVALIIDLLRKNPEDRRCVLQMWDVNVDLGLQGKDFPCNTHIYFSINAMTGALDMTVCNRSNDIIWGAYGANAVHMSMLQEYMAAAIGVKVGYYWQMSNNYHAYEEVFDKHLSILEEDSFNPYLTKGVSWYPMISTSYHSWMNDLEMFMQHGTDAIGYDDPFFRRVAVPMLYAWREWKSVEGTREYRADSARVALDACAATDWRLACQQWLERRVS